jgi:hypothetical protein
MRNDERGDTGLNHGAAFSMHPRLGEALLFYCREMSTREPPSWPVFKLLDQFNRYMVAWLLVHDHCEWRLNGGPPPTLSRLQAHQALQPRQTAAVVATLKSARLILSTPLARDRRVQQLEPLPPLIREVAQSPLAFLRAADLLLGTQAAPAIAGDDWAVTRVIHRSAASVLHGGPVLPFPRVLHFATRDCGYLILTAVMAAHFARICDEASEPLTPRALAQRLQVSPSHVRSVLTDAKTRGWFRTAQNTGVIEVDPDFVAEFEQWSCWQLAHFQDIAIDLGAHRRN